MRIAFIPIAFAMLLTHDAIGLQNQTGYLNEPYLEWSIEWDGYEGNPYDVIAHAVFTHTQSGDQRKTLLFFNGNDSFRFRFTGVKTGEWTFETEGPGALGGQSGKVSIREHPDKQFNGFLTNFGNKWGWAGSGRAFTPQLMMYKEIPELLENPEQIDRDIETFIGEHGFNGFHIVVKTRWFNVRYDRASEIDDDSPNPDSQTFEAIENLIVNTYKAGGMVHIWAWGDEQRRQTPAKWGLNKTVDQRLQRYIAARLGPLPGWSIGYGFDLDEWVTESNLKFWHHQMHLHMGWSHLLGARSRGPNRGTDHDGYQIYDGLDYAGYEHHRPSYEVYRAAMLKNPDKPVFSEDRFRIRNPSPYPDKDYDETLTRRGLWHSTMAGGVANIWGKLTGGPEYDNPHWIKTWARFFEDRFHKELEVDNSLADGVCLATPDRSLLIVYKEGAQEIEIDLSGFTVPIEAVAVDALKPYEELPITGLSADAQTWQAPYESDWAIAVGSSNERMESGIGADYESP